MLSKKDRDLAQLVAHTSGGREVAGSSPVIPTKRKSKPLVISSLDFFFALTWRVWGVIIITTTITTKTTFSVRSLLFMLSFNKNSASLRTNKRSLDIEAYYVNKDDLCLFFVK